METIVRQLLSSQIFVFGISYFAIFCSLIVTVLPYFADDIVVVQKKTESKREKSIRKEVRSQSLRTNNDSLFKGLVKGLKLDVILRIDNLRLITQQAGYRGDALQYSIYFARFALPLAFAFFAYVFTNGKSYSLLSIIFALFIGMTLPVFVLKKKAKARSDEFMKYFSDALDLLLICIESGMTAEVAMNKVAREFVNVSKVISEEFFVTTSELSYLPQRRQAYENLGKRIANREINSIITAFVQSEKYGTPLSGIVRTVAKDQRLSKMMAIEKKAAALPPKLTIPMILFFLPILFIIIMGPAFFEIKKGFIDGI